jgi:hypothetical protein
MPELGKKYTCYSCHTKFYDLGKPEPICPKCGADQRDADDTPVVTTTRRSRVVEPEPVADDDFAEPDSPVAPATGDEEEDEIAPDREEEAEEEEEEEY